jgi:hypothetical protein
MTMTSLSLLFQLLIGRSGNRSSSNSDLLRCDLKRRKLEDTFIQTGDAVPGNKSVVLPTEEIMLPENEEDQFSSSAAGGDDESSCN